MSLTESVLQVDRVRADIERVHGVIRPYIRETPVLHTTGSDVGLDAFPLTLKLEFLQHSG
jgi:threonine dehydratase